MSLDAIAWALSQPVKPSSAKFVLVAMADRVNAGSMVCWPSYRDLTERTCQDVKTVETGLKRLREAGFIVDTGERRGGTGQVIVYRLNAPENGALHTDNRTASEQDKTPESGAVDTAGKTPVFPSKTPVFPVKDPRISHERPPKTGDGTSKGISKGTSKESKESSAARPQIPGVSDALVADWMAVRKDKRAGPITGTVIKALEREATKAGITVEAAVTFCCEAGWQAFNSGWYAEREARNANSNRFPGLPKANTAPPADLRNRHSGFNLKDPTQGIKEDGSFTVTH